MRFEKLSPKQREIFKFIFSDDYALICDGAVRSGKTTVMISAFIIWAMETYDRTNFGICGKTVQSAERNVLKPLQENEDLPYTLEYKVSTRVLTVKCGRKTNWFYLFGGKDESSYMLIQGITLAGVFFDEVALMPRSFVEQALSRAISFEKPKYFFNCNPESPNHYFYKEWIEDPKENTTHIHFLLEDNPVLTEQMIERTKSMYSGVFYDRYIRGLWVIAEGLIYPMFGENCMVDETPDNGDWYISCDYGTLNPFAAGLWRVKDDQAVMVKEYYYNGRERNAQKTDEEYYVELEKLAGDLDIDSVVVDPSASSFIETIRRHGRFTVRKAKNDVLNGIITTSRYLQNGKVKIHRDCKDAIREFGLYSWDEKATEDKPIKENDHAMDQIRYFCQTVLRGRFGGNDSPIRTLL
jgi:PBSX family phage terminase large subunit